MKEVIREITSIWKERLTTIKLDAAKRPLLGAFKQRHGLYLTLLNLTGMGTKTESLVPPSVIAPLLIDDSEISSPPEDPNSIKR